MTALKTFFWFLKTVLLFCSILFFVFVMSKLWTWFAIPAGAPVIDEWHVYGLSLLLTTPLAGLSLIGLVSLDDDKQFLVMFATPFAYATSLLVGYAAKLMMP